MRKFSNFAVVALALAAVAIGTMYSGPVMAAEGKAAIEKRLEFYRNDMLKPYLAIKAFAKEGKGTAAEVKMNAELLVAAAAKIPTLFPKGTARGDYDAKLTRALPKIWEDWNGFEAAARNLAAEATKLASVAAKGDAFDIGTQFGSFGKKGCGTCHKPFRGAKVK